MTIIYFTLAISLILAGVFLAVFIWATRTGQYDDLVTPGHRILTDDNKSEKKPKTEESDDRNERD